MMSLRRLTLALAALAGGASVALSGVAGWFLASAAIMGAAGPAIAHAFNFLAPSAGVRFFALTRTLSRYTERVVGHDAVLAESARLRPRLFLALARNHARAAQLDAVGDIDARVMRDVEALEADLVQVKAPAAAAWGGLAAAMAALLFAGVRESAIVLAAFVVSYWAAPFLAHVRAGASGARLVEQRARLRALSAAMEKGGAEIRTLGAASHVLEMIETLTGNIEADETRIARSGAWISAAAGMIWAVAIAMALVTAPAHNADPAAVIAGVLASLALSDQALTQVEIGARKQERAAARVRVDAMLALGAPGVKPAPARLPWMVAARDYAALADNGRPLRPGVTFAVNAGDIAVITGRSGAGKSTLLRSLLGWRAPHAGAVTIGGAAPAERCDLTALIAYAPQAAELAPGSVRENLRWGAPEANDAGMWTALRRAGVDKVVADAGGLDAEVSALGAGFSGGEARRIGLARAFISERPLLLLDEPSEGLDAETEEAVARSIRAYVDEAPNRLAIIVTHRPALKCIANLCIDLDLGAAAAVH